MFVNNTDAIRVSYCASGHACIYYPSNCGWIPLEDVLFVSSLSLGLVQRHIGIGKLRRTWTSILADKSIENAWQLPSTCDSSRLTVIEERNGIIRIPMLFTARESKPAANVKTWARNNAMKASQICAWPIGIGKWLNQKSLKNSCWWPGSMTAL